MCTVPLSRYANCGASFAGGGYEPGDASRAESVGNGGAPSGRPRNRPDALRDAAPPRSWVHVPIAEVDYPLAGHFRSFLKLRRLYPNTLRTCLRGFTQFAWVIRW